MCLTNGRGPQTRAVLRQPAHVGETGAGRRHRGVDTRTGQVSGICRHSKSHHPSIQVEHHLDSNPVNFLDTTVFFENVDHNCKIGLLLTCVYFKPADTRALLHKASFHPKHTFKGIVKSQIIRFHRISALESDFHFCPPPQSRSSGVSKVTLRCALRNWLL